MDTLFVHMWIYVRYNVCRQKLMYDVGNVGLLELLGELPMEEISFVWY